MTSATACIPSTNAARESDATLLASGSGKLVEAAIAVASYVDKFRSEFQAHIDEAGCPFGDSSPLHNVLAPVAMHTHSPVATVPA